MKIAITGANGFVGSALCQLLVEKQHQILTITRRIWKRDEYTNLVVETYSDPNLVSALHEQECIIHLAALTHSGSKPNKRNLDIYRKINVDNTLNLAKACISAGVKRFIYLSSIKVNGEETKAIPFAYTDLPNPQDAYGITKWEAEQQLTTLFNQTGIELIILRPPLIWSKEKVKGNLALLRKWGRSGIPLPFKGLNNKRDLISLQNLCELLSICTTHPAIANQTFLVSDGLPRNTLEIASLVCQSTPNSIALPQWVYTLLGGFNKGKKLIGNLEINIDHTTSSTGWVPTKDY